jgi:Arc/MetJ-type ribon-helix-helix transcriptional regulator
MTAWRQAVFVWQRRIDVIQRALSKVLDEEFWSPATPRRLRVGSADASSRGWTMIAPELANFFLDRGGTDEPRLRRLARELRCPVYEVDVRDTAMMLVEADERGRMRVSGSPMPVVAGLAGADLDELEVASDVVSFGLVAMTDDVGDRIAALRREPPRALADYLGALAGFPGWTRLGDDAIAAGELIYEPPRILIRANGRPSARATGTHGIMAPPPETHEATARSTPRAVLPSHDRRGRRPRSASRPRR